LLLRLRKLLDIFGCVFKSDELATARQRDRIIEISRPTLANDANPFCRIRFESHPAAAAPGPFRARYTSDRARRHHRNYIRVRVCTENLIRVDDVMESTKLAE
jgi:hypothetical protein